MFLLSVKSLYFLFILWDIRCVAFLNAMYCRIFISAFFFIVSYLLEWHATSSTICIDGGKIVDGKGHSSEE